jgi:carbamoyltransferase
MIIIGINAYHADASAAIFVDGVLVAAIEEERFTRIKHWAGFPGQSILFCLKEAGVSFEQVNYFAIGRDPNAKFLDKMLYLARNPGGSFSAIKGRLANRKKVSSIEEELALLSGLPAGNFKARIKNIEHHRSHLASAFFASPFEEAACLSIDGSGDFSTAMTGRGTRNHIEVLQSINFPHSLGIFYTAFTQLLGFPHYGDEYKVMGMAPYGQPRYLDLLNDVVKLSNDGLFTLNLEYFRKGTEGLISYNQDHIPEVATMYTDLMVEKFGAARKKEEPLTQHHKDLAASVQRKTEEVIFHMLNDLHKKTGLDNLCIAGGVAQNSVANGKITRHTPFKNVYIPSAGHDAGIAMGAALYVQHQQEHLKRSPIHSAYTGSRFCNTSIKALLER